MEDFETWLSPMSYEDFWCALAFFDLDLHRSAELDAAMQDPAEDPEDLLLALKRLAALKMRRDHGLPRRRDMRRFQEGR